MSNPRIKVIDHTTGRTYSSLTKAAKALFVSKTAIAYYRDKFGNRFEMFGHDIELAPGDDYGIPVRCEETGTVYPSFRAAAEAVGVNPATISLHMSGRQKSVKGMHFVRIE